MAILDLIIDVNSSMLTSSMLTPRQTNRPKRALTSMCMEVTYKCRLLSLCLLLALVDFAHM